MTKYNVIKEQFFVSYAVRGAVCNPSYGIRYGSPSRYPIPGPVHQPSPLNSQYLYYVNPYTNSNCNCNHYH